MISHRCLKIVLAFVALLLLLTHVAAHMELSLEELVDYHKDIKRDSEALSNCMKSPDMREQTVLMLAHRDQTLDNLRKARAVDQERGKTCSRSPSVSKLMFCSKAQSRRCHEVEPHQPRGQT
jgi:hypothetical protein